MTRTTTASERLFWHCVEIPVPIQNRPLGFRIAQNVCRFSVARGGRRAHRDSCTICSCTRQTLVAWKPRSRILFEPYDSKHSAGLPTLSPPCEPNPLQQRPGAYTLGCLGSASSSSLPASSSLSLLPDAPPGALERCGNTKEYSSTYLAMGFANVRAGTQKRRAVFGYPPEH